MTAITEMGQKDKESTKVYDEILWFEILQLSRCIRLLDKII